MSNTFFQGGEKFSRVGFPPLVTGLVTIPGCNYWPVTKFWGLCWMFCLHKCCNLCR